MKDLLELHEMAERLLTAASDLHNEAIISERDMTLTYKGQVAYGRLKDLTEILAAAAEDVEEHLNYMEDEADARWKEKWAVDHPNESLFDIAADCSRAAAGG